MPNSFYEDIISNPANVIAVLSSIGTFITAFIAYRSIREMQRQRQSSYRPELYITGTHAQVFSPAFGEHLCHIRFMQYKKYKPVDQFDVDPPPGYQYDTSIFQAPSYWIATRLHNIGLGTAKRIEYKWEFDYKEAVRILRSQESKGKFIIEDGLGLKKNKKAYNLSKNDLTWFWRIDESNNGFVGNIDFLEYKNLNTVQSSINIPEDYLDILILYIFYKHDLLYADRTGKIIYDEIKDLPSLYFYISYNDIQNKTYKKKFEFSFVFSCMLNDESPIPGLAVGKRENFGNLYVEVKEIFS
nr:hypothetical protein [uncultured Sediminibacterium sp.]